MAILIDGYNLLYAMGRLTARDPKKALEGARRSLLLKMRSGQGNAAESVTVFFDAGKAPPDAPSEEEFDGIHVKFSQGESADDMIEETIRKESNPRSLTVVSDDHRIQHAARRRGCQILGCLDYYEKLVKHRPDIPSPTTPAAEQPAKPETSTREETQHWLDTFAEIDDDPRMRDGY